MKLVSGGVEHHAPDGSIDVFTGTGSGPFTSPAGTEAVLTRPTTSTYQLRFNRTGVTNTYGYAGANALPYAYLLSSTDRDGNKITFEYNPGDPGIGMPVRLLAIVDTQGRRVTFDGATFTDVAGGRWVSTTGGGGSVASARDAADKVTLYGYTSGALTSITQPDGWQTRIAYTTDTPRRVASVTRVRLPAVS